MVRAAEFGALSVPQAWAGVSDIGLAATALPAAGLARLPRVGAPALGSADMGRLGSTGRLRGQRIAERQCFLPGTAPAVS